MSTPSAPGEQGRLGALATLPPRSRVRALWSTAHMTAPRLAQCNGSSSHCSLLQRVAKSVIRDKGTDELDAHAAAKPRPPPCKAFRLSPRLGMARLDSCCFALASQRRVQLSAASRNRNASLHHLSPGLHEPSHHALHCIRVAQRSQQCCASSCSMAWHPSYRLASRYMALHRVASPNRAQLSCVTFLRPGSPWLAAHRP